MVKDQNSTPLEPEFSPEGWNNFYRNCSGQSALVINVFRAVEQKQRKKQSDFFRLFPGPES